MLRIGECDGKLAWGVAQTQPKRESLAASEIVRSGLACFWPRFRTDAGQARGRNLRALFPGYVFFGFPPGSWAWRIVRRQRGVSWVLQSGPDAPALVPAGFLRALVGHEAELAHNLVAARRALSLRPGSSVRITDHANPFCGLWAKLVTLDDTGRITVMLDILGGPTRIDGLMANQVEAV